MSHRWLIGANKVATLMWSDKELVDSMYYLQCINSLITQHVLLPYQDSGCHYCLMVGAGTVLSAATHQYVRLSIVIHW